MTMRAAQRESMMIGGGGVARRRQISNCGSWCCAVSSGAGPSRMALPLRARQRGHPRRTGEGDSAQAPFLLVGAGAVWLRGEMTDKKSSVGIAREDRTSEISRAVQLWKR